MTALFTGTSGPVERGTRITQPFGYDPTYPGAGHFHVGTDFGVITGTEATYPSSLSRGKVIIAGPFGGYGTCVVVRYEEPGVRWYLVYGHLLRVFVMVGAPVEPGAVVGLTNNTGYSFGAHLHFGVGRESYYGGGWVDPIPWLAARDDPWEVFMATLTAEQKACLTALATPQAVDFVTVWGKDFKGYLSPLGLAARDAGLTAQNDPGTPMNPVAIGIRRARELFEAIMLNKDQIAALPQPKYETLVKWIVDLQERAQEGGT